MKGTRQELGLAARGRAGAAGPVSRLVVVTVAVVAGLWVAVGGGGCQNRAGLPCQDESDCNSGLVCNKPPGTAPSGYGICEAGLHGTGEICTYSSECGSGLVCSTAVGQPSDDGWHGVCQAAPADLGVAGAADLLSPADLSPAIDAGVDM